MKSINLEEIDSTNLYLKRNYKTLDDMTFVSSEFQTLGHGRNNSNWKSEKGKNLLFSLLLSNKSIFNKFGALSMISAYSVVEMLEEYKINNVSIKWPNDVYINNCKICGILLEAITKKEMECIIVGVGLNVNQKIFNGEYKTKPTSMSLELNKDIDINELKSNVYSKLVKNIELLDKGETFLNDIRKHDYLSNKEVYGTIDGKRRKIKVLGINDDYSLKLDKKDAVISTIEWE